MDFILTNPKEGEQDKVNNMVEGKTLKITLSPVSFPEINVTTTIESRTVVHDKWGGDYVQFDCINPSGSISITTQGIVLIKGLSVQNEKGEPLSLKPKWLNPNNNNIIDAFSSEFKTHRSVNYIDDTITLDKITVIPPKEGGRKSKRRRPRRHTKRKRSRRYK